MKIRPGKKAERQEVVFEALEVHDSSPSFPQISHAALHAGGLAKGLCEGKPMRTIRY